MVSPSNIMSKGLKYRKNWFLVVFRDYSWGDFKVSIRPYGIRSLIPNKLCFNIPYFTRSDFRVHVKITVTTCEKREFAYQLAFCRERADGDITNIASNSSSYINNPSNIAESDIEAPFLSHNGRHYLLLTITYPITPENTNKARIAEFDVIGRDVFTLNVFVGLVGIIIGGLIGFFIS